MTEDRKLQIRSVFDAIAPEYDKLRFVQVTLERLVQVARLSPGMSVLDVATGTGLAALEAARAVGPNGRVVGIDLSPEMVTRARANVERAGVATVDVREGDAEALDFPDGSFDAVICASSLFLIPDMNQAVKEWARVLRSGGTAAFSAFGEGILRPLRVIWDEGLQRVGVGSTAPPQRLADPEACRAILDQAGFVEIVVTSERLDYQIESAEVWWEEMAASMDGLGLRRLAADQVERFRDEVLREVERFGESNPLVVEVPVHLAVGRKP